MVRAMVIPITQQETSTMTKSPIPASRNTSNNSCARSALRLNTVEITADTRVKTARTKSDVLPGVSQSIAGTVANQTSSESNRFTGGGNAGAAARVLRARAALDA